MPTIPELGTANFTQNQLDGLAFVNAKANAERAAQDPPKAALTDAEYLTRRVKDILSSYSDQQDAADSDAINVAMNAADPATRKAARQAARAALKV